MPLSGAFRTRFYPLFLLLSLLAAPALAQRFESGYLVPLVGDTLRGEVENAFWSDPPTAVRFRAAANAPVVTYAARQLRTVQLHSGRRLLREVLPIDYGAQTKIEYLPRNLTIKQQPDTVLADVLVQGPATLLGIRVGQVKHFFIKREQQPYLELTERRYLSEQAGRRLLMDGNNYLAQLQAYFGDCPGVVAALTKTPFTAAALSNVVQLYNTTCSAAQQPGQLITGTHRGSRVKLVVGPTLGLRYNSLRLRATDGRGQEPQTLDGVQVDGRAHGQAGLFFDVVFSGRKLALHTALTYAAFGGTTAVASPDGSDEWRGELRWQGAVTAAELGLRFLPPVGAASQLVLGTGVTLPPVQSFRANSLRYGTAEYRSVNNAYLLSAQSGRSLYGFEATFLPYLEAGIRHNRFTLLLHARRYGKESYYDPLVVFSRDAEGFPRGYSYTARTVSVAASLGIQLNGNPDRVRSAR